MRMSKKGEQRFVGGYSAKGHLFPFRTEKLSFAAPMVLPLGGRVGRRQLNIISRITFICSTAFLCLGKNTLKLCLSESEKVEWKDGRVGRFLGIFQNAQEVVDSLKNNDSFSYKSVIL